MRTKINQHSNLKKSWQNRWMKVQLKISKNRLIPKAKKTLPNRENKSIMGLELIKNTSVSTLMVNLTLQSIIRIGLCISIKPPTNFQLALSANGSRRQIQTTNLVGHERNLESWYIKESFRKLSTSLNKKSKLLKTPVKVRKFNRKNKKLQKIYSKR